MDCVYCGGRGKTDSKDTIGFTIAKHCYECDGTGKDRDTETVRSVMFDRMRSFLESWTTLNGESFDDALDKVMEIAFDTCKISEKEQNEDWRP